VHVAIDVLTDIVICFLVAVVVIPQATIATMIVGIDV